MPIPGASVSTDMNVRDCNLSYRFRQKHLRLCIKSHFFVTTFEVYPSQWRLLPAMKDPLHFDSSQSCELELELELEKTRSFCQTRT